MSELTKDDVEQFADAARAFMKASEKIEKISISNKSGINIHAGSTGTWIAALIIALGSAFVAGCALMSGFWLTDRFGSIDAQFVQVQNTDQVQDAYINKLRSQQQEKK